VAIRERVVFNALAKDAGSPPDICAFGEFLAIVFGEADPPSDIALLLPVCRFNVLTLQRLNALEIH